MSMKMEPPTGIISSGNFMGNKMIFGIKECTLTKRRGDLKWKTRWLEHWPGLTVADIEQKLVRRMKEGYVHFPYVTNGKRVSLAEEERLYSYNLLPKQLNLIEESNDESN